MMASFFFPQIGEVDLVEAYEFYDEPVLFICRDRTDLLYLAVLSDETPSHKTWLLTALSPRRFSQLRAGALDLYSAFADAERGQVYRAHLPRTPDGTSTVEWVPSAELTKKELPLVGEHLPSADLNPQMESGQALRGRHGEIAEFVRRSPYFGTPGMIIRQMAGLHCVPASHIGVEWIPIPGRVVVVARGTGRWTSPVERWLGVV